MTEIAETGPLLAEWRAKAQEFERRVSRAVIGQSRVVRLVTIAIFARGHVLLEGDVGVGKTTLLRAVARALGGAYSRIEGTVDLMPSDLIYHTYIAQDGRPRVEPGPALRHAENLSIFFFNEINRARPQVHSLLLRLMAERSVTAFDREYSFPALQVFADRNLVEREETFELPAAARDRFLMEISMRTPSDRQARRALIFDPRYHDVDRLLEDVGEPVFDHRELAHVAERIQTRVHASDALQAYVTALWEALLDPHAAGVALPGVEMRGLVRGGASPRGLAFLIRAARVRAWLEGRDALTPEDIREIFLETMAHRIFVDPIYAMRGDDIVRDLCRAAFATVPAP